MSFINYSTVIRQLRRFFQDEKGFIEFPAQSRLSILAACEDPKTIASFNFDRTLYPLPQTGQMWLESGLLNNPSLPGVFCITTSYRNEPNPVAGRHEKVFPMFEFEAAGTIDDLRKLEFELAKYLGFPTPISKSYAELSEKYGATELTAEHELLMHEEFGSAVSLEYFPRSTHPFWNMKENTDGTFNKIDIILSGMETFGSAERSTDAEQMRHNFHHISDGQYAQLLFDMFTKERVLAELDTYLSLPMFPRFGAGLGVGRIIRAMLMENLLNPETALLAA